MAGRRLATLPHPRGFLCPMAWARLWWDHPGKPAIFPQAAPHKGNPGCSNSWFPMFKQIAGGFFIQVNLGVWPTLIHFSHQATLERNDLRPPVSLAGVCLLSIADLLPGDLHPFHVPMHFTLFFPTVFLALPPYLISPPWPNMLSRGVLLQVCWLFLMVNQVIVDVTGDCLVLCLELLHLVHDV